MTTYEYINPNKSTEPTNIPIKYQCSLTLQLFKEPVFTCDGMTYEKEAIEKWLSTNNTSPTTGLVLADHRLTPNIDKKSDVDEFITQNSLLESDEVYFPELKKKEYFDVIESKDLEKVRSMLLNDNRLFYLHKIESEITISVFYFACKYSSEIIVDFFVDYINQKQIDINYVLKFYVHQSDVFFLDLLLYESLSNMKSFQKKWKLIDLVRLGASINLELTTGEHLLTQFIRDDNLLAVDWLLNQDLLVFNNENDSDIILTLAVKNKSYEMTRLLFLDVKGRFNIFQEDKAGYNSIYYAFLLRSREIITLFFSEEFAIQSFLHIICMIDAKYLTYKVSRELLLETILQENLSFSSNESIDELNDQQESPLFVSITNNHIECCRILLNHGADPFIMNGHNYTTCFQQAVHLQNIKLVEMLLIFIKINDKIDQKDIFGNTALHIAIESESDNLRIIELLINAGASLKIKNLMKYTPLDIAKLNKRLDIIDFIDDLNHKMKINDRLLVKKLQHTIITTTTNK